MRSCECASCYSVGFNKGRCFQYTTRGLIAAFRRPKSPDPFAPAEALYTFTVYSVSSSQCRLSRAAVLEVFAIAPHHEEDDGEFSGDGDLGFIEADALA
jgi:hypothetical protein